MIATEAHSLKSRHLWDQPVPKPCKYLKKRPPYRVKVAGTDIRCPFQKGLHPPPGRTFLAGCGCVGTFDVCNVSEGYEKKWAISEAGECHGTFHLFFFFLLKGTVN